VADLVEIRVIEALTFGPFTATDRGLLITNGVAFDEWAAYGAQLQTLHAAIHWLIGDWLNYGELHYGEDYTQAENLTGYSKQTLYNDKFVAARIPAEERRPEISHSTHAVTASMKPEQRREVLERAAEEGLTREEVRQTVKQVDPVQEKINRIRALLDELLALLDGKRLDAVMLVKDMLRDAFR